MGFQLFETSGVFDPTVWGLKTGDALYIIAIGGGGGGGAAWVSESEGNGSNGSASSFGSVVNAAGGNGGYGGEQYGTTNIIQAGSCPGSRAYFTNVEYGYSRALYAGSGGDGWFPGMSTPRCAAVPTPNDNGYISDTLGHVWGLSGNANPTTIDRGNNGQGGIYYLGGCGGLGYGAGGGGGNRDSEDSYSGAGGNGGNGGVKITTFYILPSTSPITVTVGDGGAGGTTRVDGYDGGGGSRGCVCVFW